MSMNLRARFSAYALVPILAAQAAAVRPLPIGDVFPVDERSAATQDGVAIDAAAASGGGALDFVHRRVFAADFETGSFAGRDAVVDPGKDRAEFLALSCE